MILFGLIAVVALVVGAALVIFAFVEPPGQLSWINNIELTPLTAYMPASTQRFLLGLLIAFGIPFLLFGVLSNNM